MIDTFLNKECVFGKPFVVKMTWDEYMKTWLSHMKCISYNTHIYPLTLYVSCNDGYFGGVSLMKNPREL